MKLSLASVAVAAGLVGFSQAQMAPFSLDNEGTSVVSEPYVTPTFR